MCTKLVWYHVRNRDKEEAYEKGEKVVTLHHGDAINLVDIPAVNGGAAINRIEEFVSTPGIDFIYENSTRVLKIQVRHNCFLVEESCVAAALNLHGVELPAQGDAGNYHNITLGTLFLYEGSIIEVIGINDNEILIRDEETGRELIMNANEASTSN